MKIYAITLSFSTPTMLANTEFFSTKESAQKELKNIRNERIYKPGVMVIEDNADQFKYLFGWEEKQVNYEIKEIECR